MAATAAASSSSTHPFLTSKVQVGSAKSDKINFSIAHKVFHVGDVPKDVVEAKRQVQKQKQPNILGTEPRPWNSSTIADGGHKFRTASDQDVTKDLKRQLLKVRSGLMDEYSPKPSKFHSDEKIAEQHKFIAAMTGQGPCGKLSGKWCNTVDERGLAQHCINDDWPDWNASHCTHTKDDQKDAMAVFQQKEERRQRMVADTNKKYLRDVDYINPQQAITNINDRIRERKIDFQDLKEQFKRELKVEFPQASENRLKAMAQRLLNEKLLADEKLARFPVQHNNFRPNISLTTQDRRYKEYYHNGAWVWNESEQRHVCSACGRGQDSRGCEWKIINPDARRPLGFERGCAMAASGRR